PSSGAWSGGQNRERRKDMSFEQEITLVADIMSPPNFEFVLEHKAYNEASFWDLFNEKSDLNSWLKQVEEDAEFVEKIPMLIVKYNRKKRIAYTTKKINNPVFIYGKWYCAFFDDVLKMDKSWWFQS
ncbi:MAG: putative PDDEXK endonuclease, partial [Nanoarchaeota archaeon]